MGATQFHSASAVLSDGDRATAHIQRDWDILGAVNGGYLLATATRALVQRTGRQPVTATGHYLAPGRPGPAEIDTQVVKEGAAFSTGIAVLSQQGRPVVGVMASLGRIVQDPDILLQDAQPPDMPDVDGLTPMGQGPGAEGAPAFMGRIDQRLHPDDLGFAYGKPTGRARMRAYWRLVDEPMDALALILAADSLPPTTFNSGLPVAWTPTLELTVHLRALPAPGFLRLDYRTRFISHGRLEVDGLIWDGSDQLVAQSRQLALLPKA